ncbi:uncharacterized protein METZ01_LOCUS281688 [marine metagenome]|uniref:Uncharacterized protein n=1 Tax=marine metagenome TaxID=408172 RepID=A0A382KVL6_9ZZZZ
MIVTLLSPKLEMTAVTSCAKALILSFSVSEDD